MFGLNCGTSLFAVQFQLQFWMIRLSAQKQWPNYALIHNGLFPPQLEKAIVFKERLGKLHRLNHYQDFLNYFKCILAHCFSQLMAQLLLYSAVVKVKITLLEQPKSV